MEERNPLADDRFPEEKPDTGEYAVTGAEGTGPADAAYRQTEGEQHRVSGFAEENYFGNTAVMRGESASVQGAGGNTGRIPVQRGGGYGNTGRIPVQRDIPYGNTGRIPTQREIAYGNTGRIPTQRETAYGNTDRIPTQRETAYGNTGRIPTQRETAYGSTGRIPVQRGGGYGNTGRVPVQREAAYPNAGSASTQRRNASTQRRNAYDMPGRTQGQNRARAYASVDEPDPNETGRLKIDRQRAAQNENEYSFGDSFAESTEENVSPTEKIAANRKVLRIGGALLLIALIVIGWLIFGRNTSCSAQKPVTSVEETAVPETAPVVTPVPTPVITAPPAATPHPCATPLQQGMSAPVVAEIQERLIELGYMDYPLVDGAEQVTTVYGSTTKNALQCFQMKNGLTSDGWCGVTTYDLLMSDKAQPFSVKRGDGGANEKQLAPMIKKMQQRLIALGYLNISIPTGNCGQSTETAIREFQQANGLEADGKAGSITLQTLYSDEALDTNGNAVRMPSVAERAGETAKEDVQNVDISEDTEKISVENDEVNVALEN